MTSINTNLSSLIVQKNLTKSTNGLNQAIERLTTGFKINHASDNAANYSISESMSSKLSSYMVAEDNTSMGLDLIQTQSSTLDTIQNLTTRLRALAEQAHNGTYGAQSLAAINQEADAIISEIERIGNNAEYNGIKLFDNALSQSSIPQLKSNGLMQEVERRDTSGMTRLADVDENTSLAAGTYSISSVEELAKLATMHAAWNIPASCEFVLGADIDMSKLPEGETWNGIGDNSCNFSGTFDGNGYTISNLKGDRGLFNYIEHGVIKNLKLTGVNIINENENANVGGLIDNLAGIDTTITNCSVTGNIKNNNGNSGLLIGNVNASHRINMSKCYVSGSVSSSGISGGLIGNIDISSDTLISDCYSSADVTGSIVGGLIGKAKNTDISNSAACGKIKGSINAGGVAGYYSSNHLSISIEDAVSVCEVEALNCGTIIGAFYRGTNNDKVNISATCDSVANKCKNTIGRSSGTLASENVADLASSLQVGIDSSDSSKIGFTTNMSLSSIASLRGGMEEANSLENIDSFISKLSDAQTKLGAIENRLTSTLESIAVNVENLTSSCSTLKDADVAKESSQLLKNQISQQASATLLATANQTPTLVLRLLNGM